MPGNSIRSLRVAELIKHEIAAIISSEINDPRVHDVVITKVSVTKDLSLAKVYFSSYDKSSMRDIQIGLDKSSGFIKRRLMNMVYLRKVPALTFIADDIPENVEKLDRLFKELHKDGE